MKLFLFAALLLSLGGQNGLAAGGAGSCGACQAHRNLFAVDLVCKGIEDLNRIEQAGSSEIYTKFQEGCRARGTNVELAIKIQNDRWKYCTTAEAVDKIRPQVAGGLEKLEEKECSSQLERAAPRLDSILTSDYCQAAQRGGLTCADIQQGTLLPPR